MRKWQVFGDQSIHLQIGVRSLHQFGRGRQSKRPRGNLSFIIRFDYSHSFQLTIIAFFFNDQGTVRSHSNSFYWNEITLKSLFLINSCWSWKIDSRFFYHELRWFMFINDTHVGQTASCNLKSCERTARSFHSLVVVCYTAVCVVEMFVATLYRRPRPLLYDTTAIDTRRLDITKHGRKTW